MSNKNVIMYGDWNHILAIKLKLAYEQALANDSKLSDQLKRLEGMSGIKYRNLINRLIEKLDEPKYLEIGVWGGSTFLSAIYNNKISATAIDIWQGAEQAKKDVFLSRLNEIKTSENDVLVLQNDFRNVDFSTLGKFNVYLFDGPHDYQDQKDAIALVHDVLDDEYILIVDDYNEEKVQKGTQDGLRASDQSIIASITILTEKNPYLTPSDWHNGYYIAVVKNKAHV